MKKVRARTAEVGKAKSVESVESVEGVESVEVKKKKKARSRRRRSTRKRRVKSAKLPSPEVVVERMTPAFASRVPRLLELEKLVDSPLNKRMLRPGTAAPLKSKPRRARTAKVRREQVGEVHARSHSQLRLVARPPAAEPVVQAVPAFNPFEEYAHVRGEVLRFLTSEQAPFSDGSLFPLAYAHFLLALHELTEKRRLSRSTSTVHAWAAWQIISRFILSDGSEALQLLEESETKAIFAEYKRRSSSRTHDGAWVVDMFDSVREQVEAAICSASGQLADEFRRQFGAFQETQQQPAPRKRRPQRRRTWM